MLIKPFGKPSPTLATSQSDPELGPGKVPLCTQDPSGLGSHRGPSLARSSFRCWGPSQGSAMEMWGSCPSAPPGGLENSGWRVVLHLVWMHGVREPRGG